MKSLFTMFFPGFFQIKKSLTAIVLRINDRSIILLILSVPKFTANLYCNCLSINLRYTQADAVQICGKFWDTQYAPWSRRIDYKDQR